MPSLIESDNAPTMPGYPSGDTARIGNIPEILERAPDAMIVADREGRIAWVNARTEELFGYERDEMLGRSVDMLVPDRLRREPVGGRSPFFDTPELGSTEPESDLYGLRRDGSEFPVDIRLNSFEAKDGTVVIASIRDLTERRRFEDELREKIAALEQANLTKEHFLAGMSHELRTPLNAIIGFAGTLLMRLPGPLTAAQEKQLRIIETSAKHLLSLINDVLDLAKIEAGKMKPNAERFVCQEVIRQVAETLRPMAERRRLRFDLELPPDDIVVETDRRALVQILINLVNNAIKFTSQGGISIELKQRRESDAMLIDIRVSDTGIGIKPEDQSRLFQAFTQLDAAANRSVEGTGLGLYLCRKLASLIGGHIAVRSEYGSGSTFTVSFPAKSPD